MFFNKVFYEDREVENERLELTDKNSIYSLGSNLTLKSCTLVLKVSARRLFIDQARFIDCTFEVKQELKNHQQWVFAYLERCRFKGRFSGCDFGRWPTYPGAWEHAAIKDCDFSEARLDGCRFHGCDPATLRFPRWPCFTILDPIRRSAALAAMDWPGDIGSITMKGHAREPPSTVAVTWFAPVLAKENGTTPEVIKALLEKCEGVLY